MIETILVTISTKIHKYIKNKVKVRFIGHYSKDWDIIKNNLFLDDDSMCVKISWNNNGGVIYGGIKNGCFSYLHGTLHTLTDYLEGFDKLFAENIEKSFHENQYDKLKEKHYKKYIRKIYKQSISDWENR